MNQKTRNILTDNALPFILNVVALTLFEFAAREICNNLGSSPRAHMLVSLGIFVGFGIRLFGRAVTCMREIAEAQDWREQASHIADDVFDHDDEEPAPVARKRPRRMPKWLQLCGALACVPPLVESIIEATKGFFGYPPGNLLDAGVVAVVAGVPLGIIWWHLGRGDDEAKS